MVNSYTEEMDPVLSFRENVSSSSVLWTNVLTYLYALMGGVAVLHVFILPITSVKNDANYFILASQHNFTKRNISRSFGETPTR